MAAPSLPPAISISTFDPIRMGEREEGVNRTRSAFMNTPYRGSPPEVHSNFHFHFLPMIWRTAPSYILWDHRPRRRRRRDITHIGPSPTPPTYPTNSASPNFLTGAVVSSSQKEGRRCLDDGRRLQKGFYPPSENISCRSFAAAAFSRGGTHVFPILELNTTGHGASASVSSFSDRASKE